MLVLRLASHIITTQAVSEHNGLLPLCFMLDVYLSRPCAYRCCLPSSHNIQVTAGVTLWSIDTADWHYTDDAVCRLVSKSCKNNDTSLHLK